MRTIHTHNGPIHRHARGKVPLSAVARQVETGCPQKREFLKWAKSRHQTSNPPEIGPYRASGGTVFYGLPQNVLWYPHFLLQSDGILFNLWSLQNPGSFGNTRILGRLDTLECPKRKLGCLCGHYKSRFSVPRSFWGVNLPCLRASSPFLGRGRELQGRTLTSCRMAPRRSR